MDIFIQITVVCPPEYRVGAFVYRKGVKVYYYWFTLLNAIIKRIKLMQLKRNWPLETVNVGYF